MVCIKPLNLKPLSKKMVAFCKPNRKKRSQVRKVVWEKNRKRDMKQRGKGSKEMPEREEEGGVMESGAEEGVYKEVEAGEVALAVGSWFG